MGGEEIHEDYTSGKIKEVLIILVGRGMQLANSEKCNML